MARTLATLLGVWVAISIPAGLVVGRFIAGASRLSRSEPTKLWVPEPHRRAA
jgi:hypothetical protein